MSFEIKFLMDTDWVFDEPIDYEYKKYKLLAYFKKLDELIKDIKIYPMFTELSVHLASLQTILKENVILSTNKSFKSYDDEVLLKDLIIKTPPKLNTQEIGEIDKILKLAGPKFLEYFEIFKSHWMYIYDSITLKIKRNSKNISSEKGYMVYEDKKNSNIFIWEYYIKPLEDDKQFITYLNLIFNGKPNEDKFNNIIGKYSAFTTGEQRKVPVFEIKCNAEAALDETLVPLFKRKIISYIFQSANFNLNYQK